MMTVPRTELVFGDAGSAVVKRFLVVSIEVVVVGKVFQEERKLDKRRYWALEVWGLV